MNNLPQRHFGISGWRDVYNAALEETNIPKLFRLVEIAEPILLLRRDALEGVRQREPELSAVDDALQTLSIIKRDRLSFVAHTDLE